MKRTRINPISEKKKQRLREQGSEKDMFNDIWQYETEDGDRNCLYCGKRIHEYHISCFAHLVAKSKRPDLRLYKNNIGLVHGVFEANKKGKRHQCHQKIDTLISGLGIQLEVLIENGEYITKELLIRMKQDTGI